MYVSSHPLAGLRKYIGKKADLIANLSQKEAGKTVTIAGVEEGVKKLTTKKENRWPSSSSKTPREK